MADTTLTCRACAHQHTQADWEYQAGHCHACGAPLEIPHDDPSYAQWVTGPKSKAAIELERAAEIAKRSEPDPGPLPAPASPVTDDDEEEEDDEDEDDEEDVKEDPPIETPSETPTDVVTTPVKAAKAAKPATRKVKGVDVPTAIRVDEHGKVAPRRRRK